MTFGINPIAAESTRNALVENDGQAAFEADENSSRAALDAAELREIERSMYYRRSPNPSRRSRLSRRHPSLAEA